MHNVYLDKRDLFIDKCHTARIYRCVQSKVFVRIYLNKLNIEMTLRSN